MNIQRINYRGTPFIVFTNDEGTVIPGLTMPLPDAADLAHAILFEQQDQEIEDAHE